MHECRMAMAWSRSDSNLQEEPPRENRRVGNYFGPRRACQLAEWQQELATAFLERFCVIGAGSCRFLTNVLLSIFKSSILWGIMRSFGSDIACIIPGMGKF